MSSTSCKMQTVIHVFPTFKFFFFISQKLNILFPHFWENIKRNQYLVISYIFVDFVVELINENKMLIEEHTVLRKIMPTDYFATVVLFRSKSLF